MTTDTRPITETIAAIASAPGKSARGIVRVSGEQTLKVLGQVLLEAEFNTQRATRSSRRLRLTADGLTLPVDLYLWPTARSFTGEPLAEIHCIGSPPILNEVLELITASGARPAEPGEFTLRAFLSGRIDLVQAEAVLGVINAAGQQQLHTALMQLAGGISGKIAQIREQLLLHLADLEAGLDFVEEDIDFVQRPEFLKRIATAREFVSQLLNESVERMQSSARYRVVLAGLPNAGKSTLFNSLVENDMALVSEIAGTTRDYLTADLKEQGLTYTICDTAGWEPARDEIETLAGALRDEQLDMADLIVWCEAENLTDEEQRVSARHFDSLAAEGHKILTVMTKCDLSQSAERRGELSVCAPSGENITHLKRRIVAELSSANADTEILSSTAARCRESLRHAHESLLRTESLMESGVGDELIAMELREVLDHLGRIVGAVYTDDILDRIFSRFCIGK